MREIRCRTRIKRQDQESGPKASQRALRRYTQLVLQWLGQPPGPHALIDATLSAASLEGGDEVNHHAPQSALPPEARTVLHDLGRALREVLGANLVGVVAFGAAVRGDWGADRNDLEIAVVLVNDTPASFDQMRPLLRGSNEERQIKALVLVDSEIPHSLDCFSVLFDDIRRCHELIVGHNPFASMQIPYEHLRVGIEHNLHDATLRLRGARFEEADSREALAHTVRRTVRHVRTALHALLCLQHVSSGNTLGEVLDRAGHVYGIDVRPLLDVNADPRHALETLNALLRRSANDVDTPGDWQ